MSRRYMEAIVVEVGDDPAPVSFVWRGKLYRVKEVLGQWHLMDRWWDQGDLEGAHSRDAWRRTRANRYRWRVEVQEHMVFALYLDVARRPPL